MLALIRSRLASADPIALILYAAAALIAAGILKDAALFAFDRDRELIALADLFLLNAQVSDGSSWMPMHRAVEHFRTAADPAIYQTIFFDQQTKFQYPPTSLLPFLGLDMLGVSAGAVAQGMQLLSVACVAGIVAISIALVRDPALRPVLAPHSGTMGANWALPAAAAVGTLFFYPIMFGHQIGQIQVMIDLAVALGVLCWMKDRKGAAGALLAFAALIKPQFGLVLLWALLRREHRFTAGFLLLGLPIGLLSLVVFGFEEYFDYLHALSFMGRHGEVYWPNQSMNGLLNRLFSGVDPIPWSFSDFAPFNPLVYAGTVISSLALVALGLFWRPSWLRRTDAAGEPLRKRESLLDFSTAVMILTIASPIAWEHHYGVAWPVLIVMFTTLVALYARRPDRLVAGLLVGLGLAYLLVSNYFSDFERFSAAPFNVVQSYIFAGGLIMLATLVRLRTALDPVAALKGEAASAA